MSNKKTQSFQITSTGIRMLHALKDGAKTSRALAALLRCSAGTPQYIFNKLKPHKLINVKREKLPNSHGSVSSQWVYSLAPGAADKIPPLPAISETATEEDKEDGMGFIAPELLRLEKRLKQCLDEARCLRALIVPAKNRGVIQQLIKSGIRFNK